MDMRIAGRRTRWIGTAILTVALASAAAAEPVPPPDPLTFTSPLAGCYERSVPPPEAPVVDDDPLLERLSRYVTLQQRHRLRGLASYYSSKFDGRKTANGEIFRNRKHTAAHLTLPLGTWIEVTARATGKKLRMRVNDRGPYAKKFALDLSQAAARYLGVDRARDRHVECRIIALPGEEPIPDHVDLAELEAKLAGGVIAGTP